MTEQLIPRFVQLNAEAMQLIEQNDTAGAKEKYLEVLDAYHLIQKSPLEKYHKDIAYSRVTQLFSKVNEAKERTKVPYNLIAAAILIIAFSILVVIKPSIVGLVGIENTARQPINLTFEESRLQDITLSEKPLSISLSGIVNGSAKVFYKQGSKLELIVDTAVSGQNFTDVCSETCSIAADSNTITLFVDLAENSTLALTDALYKIEQRNNNPPEWKGKSRTFSAKISAPTIIDLNDYFTDKDGDKLVFLSTTDEGIDVTVQDSFVTFVPLTSGTKHVVIIASDMRNIARVPVAIEVQ